MSKKSLTEALGKNLKSRLPRGSANFALPRRPAQEIPKSIGEILNESIEIRGTEIGSFEDQSTKSQPLQKEGTVNESTENKSSQNQRIQIQGTEFESSDFRSPQEESTENQNFEIKCSENKSTQIQDLDIESLEVGGSENECPENPRRKNSGYFKLRHDIFEQNVVRDLTGECFRLFIWMSARAWGFKNSNGETRIAVDYAAERIGITPSSVSRCFNILIEKKLIRLKQKNHKLGNLWLVSGIAFTGGPDSEKSKNESSQNRNSEPQKSDNNVPKIGTEHSENRGQSRIVNNYINHSFNQNVTAGILDYFEKIKATGKYKKELDGFLKAEARYDYEMLTKGLAYLIANGIPGSKETCLYPMCFMAKRMDFVLEAIEKHEKKAVATKHRVLIDKTTEVERLQDIARENRFPDAQVAFFEAFPTTEQRHEFLDSFTKSKGAFYRMLPEAQRQIEAIDEWYLTRLAG